jgi:predicted TIM-barrel fold metal-dependent hydrolase
MSREGFLIMDSDLHLMEPEDLWARYLDEPYRANPPKFFGAQKQSLTPNKEDKGNTDTIFGMEVQGQVIPAFANAQGAIRQSRELARRSRARHPHFQVARTRGFDPASTLAAMDIEGIDVAVMYGTRGRQILMHDDLAPDYAAALARAYNNWAHEYCQSHPERLRFAGQVAMHDVGLAVEEARRCVNELGAVAIIGTPNPVNGLHLHDEAVEPLWNELERLNVPIGFHPTGNSSLKDDVGRRFVGHNNYQPIAHAARGPMELMMAMASMTTGGVLERHPKLRCAFLEGTAGWLGWWLWRLDDHWEKFGPGCEQQLSMLPSEYFKRQCYIALDVDEEPAVEVIRQIGAEYFVCSTDYPHPDGAFPEAFKQFFGLPLSDDQRRKILWENCARLYQIETPATMLKQESKTVSANK